MLALLAKTGDIIGIAGVILLLIAYYLLNINKITALSMSYQLLNLIGAVGILYSLLFSWNLSSFTIEVAWVLISGIGIYRSLQNKAQVEEKRNNLYQINSDEAK